MDAAQMTSGDSIAAKTGEGSWQVVCLCAAWCGVCRQYEAEFQSLAIKFPGVRFSWMDVEEQEAVVGDLDVETFPTLLVANGEQAIFLGPLLPQISVLDRLLQSLQVDQAPAANLPPEAAGLLHRIRSL